MNSHKEIVTNSVGDFRKKYLHIEDKENENMEA